jgi:hypothetical protein
VELFLNCLKCHESPLGAVTHGMHRIHNRRESVKVVLRGKTLRSIANHTVLGYSLVGDEINKINIIQLLIRHWERLLKLNFYKRISF